MRKLFLFGFFALCLISANANSNGLEDSIVHTYQTSRDNQNTDKLLATQYTQQFYIEDDRCFMRFCISLDDGTRVCSDWVEVPCGAEIEVIKQ